MCQCGFICGNTGATLVDSVENGGGCVQREAEGIREISVLSAQFFCEPKTALKHEAYFFFLKKKDSK